MKIIRFIAGTLLFLLIPAMKPIKVVKFTAGVRFFVLIPVIGLVIAAYILFINYQTKGKTEARFSNNPAPDQER